ncbi:MAG TPA: HIT domain-containing protein [Ilumatobacter sp.]|nr:HIT domain-containing protein [Ilumatobacter sp.]
MTALEHLWSGWRARYIVGGEGRRPDDGTPGSVFTRLLESGLPDEETNIVHRGELAFAVMNAYPYAVGHLLVLPYAEVPDLTDLDPATTAELWATVTDAVRAVRAAIHPLGVNVGVNLGRAAGGSVPEHLHVHVVPRWPGDSNFMATVAGATTLPEALPVTARKIRAAWPPLD